VPTGACIFKSTKNEKDLMLIDLRKAMKVLSIHAKYFSKMLAYTPCMIVFQ
jgi:hypothetical protein